jgi:tRNA(Ile2) C34 agmatinyltransferase TiaS
LEDLMPLQRSIAPSSAGAVTVVTPAPPCPECAVELLAVGAGRHRYWTCHWCGTTMPLT